MVVLGMLALFLLLGTAFIVSSNFYQQTAKDAAKENRTENNPTDLLERAMLQVVRDTNNPFSALRGHSLLRDMYGGDGFIGQVLVPNESRPDLMAQYAGASSPNNLAGPLGATGGQLIDIFVFDRLAPTNGNGVPTVIPDNSYVIDLERDPSGQPVDLTLSTATDYYAGCVLTMLSGPATGQSARIIDSRVVTTLDDTTTINGTDTTVLRPVTRLRVMVFSQKDGTPLNVDGGDRTIELTELAGHAFMVNGRAFNGTGVGYNRLARSGSARLSTVELTNIPGGFIGTEIALTPNSQFVNTQRAAHHLRNPNIDPFKVGVAASDLQTAFTLLDINNPLYGTPIGPGGADESYDIADYQNMFLAAVPLVPRARGGLIDSNGAIYPLDSQEANQLISNTQVNMRLDLDNIVLPSYHRPALINYWFHRLHTAPWVTSEFSNANERAQAIIAPYANANPGDNAVLDQIVALKRKISLRPIPEDHPNFDGSNPASTYSGTTTPLDLQTIATPTQIRFPFWEAVGPWDVDNDNDGINDSVWVDLGDPVQKTEDGRLYKALYAIMVIDLDNRLDMNAHGSPDHFANTDFDHVLMLTTSDRNPAFAGNLASGEQNYLDANNSPTLWSSNRMPVGLGLGAGRCEFAIDPVASDTTMVVPLRRSTQHGDIPLRQRRLRRLRTFNLWPPTGTCRRPIHHQPRWHGGVGSQWFGPGVGRAQGGPDIAMGRRHAVDSARVPRYSRAV